LITGEELIAVTTVKRAVFELNDPYQIFKDLRTEKTIYQIDRWMPYANSPSFVIEKKNVITYNTPTEELNLFYELVKKAELEPYDEHYNHTGQVH
jgi:hypothetical protein